MRLLAGAFLSQAVGADVLPLAAIILPGLPPGPPLGVHGVLKTLLSGEFLLAAVADWGVEVAKTPFY